jgi:hypothetical protein
MAVVGRVVDVTRFRRACSSTLAILNYVNPL